MESLNPLYEERLGKQDSCSDMLVVPTKRVISLCCAQGLPISPNVVEIRNVLGRLVQPSSSPQKLILHYYNCRH
nr:Os01g0313050 [Ipomoea batatas]